MAHSIGINELSQAIADTLEEYIGVTEAIVIDAVDEAATTAKNQLKTTSPQNTGKYAKSWKVRKTNGNKTAEVYNTQYQLTHLLEYGHATRNGGRTKAQPHIADAEKIAEQVLEESIKKGLASK